jgi:hypothetical protein
VSDETPLPSQAAPVVRGCAWCTRVAVGQCSNGWWACEPHLTEHERLDQAVRESAAKVAAVEAEIKAEERGALGLTRTEAYEDAIRNIAAAVVRARSRATTMGQLRPADGGDLLAEAEHQLGALIAAGFVPGPPDPGRRPLTASPFQ